MNADSRVERLVHIASLIINQLFCLILVYKSAVICRYDYRRQRHPTPKHMLNMTGRSEFNILLEKDIPHLLLDLFIFLL